MKDDSAILYRAGRYGRLSGIPSIVVAVEDSRPNNMVARMTNCGILEEFTGHSRNRAFRYRGYIHLFHKALN